MLFLFLITNALTSSIVFAQTQTIGSFPFMDGGFENQATGALGTALSSTAWSRQNQSGATTNIVTTTPRSGAKYASIVS